MTLKQLTSMNECVYFTNRSTGKGKIKAWVFKELCPNCKKSLIGKPLDEKTGKPKIRAKEYVCKECNHTIPQQEYEDTLTINIQYTCSHCSYSGELQAPFKRKKVKIFDEEAQKEKTADSIRFQCEKCSKDIDITKKMK
ncbi:MAG: hypothetical protein AABW46_01330 [Nanoarchaeota archaeon]